MHPINHKENQTNAFGQSEKNLIGEQVQAHQVIEQMKENTVDNDDGKPEKQKHPDLVSCQYDLLSQKVENKKLSIQNRKLEEEKAALQKQSKTLTSMYEKLAEENRILFEEKKVLLRENENMSLENKRLQDENMRIKGELYDERLSEESADAITEETIFHIHDKQINHVDICCFNRKELLIAASGHIVKVSNVEDGKLLWSTVGRGSRNVSCMTTITMPGLSVLACGYYGNNIDCGSSIDFICLKTFTTLASFTCSSPVYLMNTEKQDEKYLLFCAYQSGSIDIFDMRSQRLLTTLLGTRENPIGFDRFILGRDFHLAVAGNVENYIDIWYIGRDESKVTLTIPVQCKKMNSLCTFKQTFGGQVHIAVGTEDYAGGWNILIFNMNNYNAVKTIHSTCLRGLMYLKPVSINGVLKLASGCYLSDEIDFWEIDTLRRDRSNGIKSEHSLTCYNRSIVAGSSDGNVVYKVLNSKKRDAFVHNKKRLRYE